MKDDSLSQFDGYIFDFDGTIADSMWVWNQVDREFMASRGIEYRDDYCEAIAAMGFEGSADFFIETFNLDETRDDIITEWQQQASHKYATQVMLKEHAKDYLISLKSQGKKVALATSLQRLMLEPALKNNGIEDFFDAIVVCEEVCEGGKKTPAAFIEAAKRIGTDLANCAVFEDVAIAARSAKQAGAYVVAIRDDHPQQIKADLLDACDKYIQGWDELL